MQQSTISASSRPSPSNPGSFKPDMYLERAMLILKGENMDPEVTVQVFVREGPGIISGLGEAAEFIRSRCGERVSIMTLTDGEPYEPGETVMLLNGPLSLLMSVETGYLGIIAAATTTANNGPDPDPEPDPEQVRRRAAHIKKLLGDRPAMFFGARHWHPDRVRPLREAAMDAGFKGCMGTMPHALVLAFGHRFGRERGTSEALRAFDRHVPKDAPRAVLVDTFGREIDDTLACARALGPGLNAIRIDTAEESSGQGTLPFDGRQHITGPGVTVESVRAVRDALADEGFGHVKIILSSGFGEPGKLEAFVDAENKYGRLFDILGAGGLFDARHATADVVEIEGTPFAKNGRMLKPNHRLKSF